MKFIDPTYLRSIADDLAAGAINKDNPAALPDGLAGIFEKALPPEQNVRERKRFLEFFSVWALLKKEVSAAFVVPLLDGWCEEDVSDYIARYSKWFNSSESGKYVLYHERFRMFLLQKISESDVLSINQRIIDLCFSSLKNKQADEWERYALEHASTQLLLSSMRSKFGGDELKKLAYDTNHWNRQIEISKGFNWSKNMLNDLMLWASKYDDDEVIECALNKLDLHNREQNDAEGIFELVKKNKIECALQRIETFGGDDQVGVMRRFILYILCLISLIFSKDRVIKNYKKTYIEYILRHMKITINQDYVWDWFPTNVTLKLVCEISKLGLVINSSEYFDIRKAMSVECYKNKLEVDFLDIVEVRVLHSFIHDFSEHDCKLQYLTEFALELVKKGNFQYASLINIEVIQMIQDLPAFVKKLDIINNITLLQLMLGEEKLTAKFMNEAEECSKVSANDFIEFEHVKYILKHIQVLDKPKNMQNKIILKECLKHSLNIRNKFWKDYALSNILPKISKYDSPYDLIKIIKQIENVADKCIIYSKLAIEFSNVNKESISFKIISEIFDYINLIQEAKVKNEIIDSIIDLVKNTSLKKIVLDASFKVIDYCLEIDNLGHDYLIPLYIKKASLFSLENKHAESSIALEQANKLVEIKYSLNIFHGDNTYGNKICDLLDIYEEVFRQQKISEFMNSLLLTINFNSQNDEDEWKEKILMSIAVEALNRGQCKIAYELAKILNDYFIFSTCSFEILLLELLNQNNFEEAIKLIKEMESEWFIDNVHFLDEEYISIEQNSRTIRLYSIMALEFAKRGKIKEACYFCISNDCGDSVLSDILFIAADYVCFDELKKYTESIKDTKMKNSLIMKIKAKISKRGKFKNQDFISDNKDNYVSGIIDFVSAYKGEKTVSIFGKKHIKYNLINYSTLDSKKKICNNLKKNYKKTEIIELIMKEYCVMNLFLNYRKICKNMSRLDDILNLKWAIILNSNISNNVKEKFRF
jgi:hypothetical protein